MNTNKYLPLNDLQVDRVTSILRAYKHPFRYDMIDCLLNHGKLTSHEIASYLQLEESYIVEQLQILRSSQLVMTEESGRGRLYKANEPKLMKLKQIVRNFLK